MLTPVQFSKAYEKAFRLTRGLLLSRGVGPTVAEELAQAAWARAWERRRQLRQTDRLVPWVSMIAMNLLRNEMRRYGDHLPLLDSQLPNTRSTNDCSSVLSKVDLDRAMKLLSNEDRRLLIASVIGGLTSQETAARAQLSPGAVRVRLHRARRLVQERRREIEKQRAA